MLSPVEALGLSGATLEARVRRALHHVSDAALVRVAERLAADARDSQLVYERDASVEPVRIMLRPLLAMPEQLSYVHHVCARITDALRRVPELYLRDADVRRALPIRDDEAAWLRESWSDAHAHANPVYGRLDAVCDFTSPSWRDSLLLMEPNLSGIGGIHYAPVAEQLVMRDVVPSIVAHDPELAIELPRDQRELFLQVLVDHARAVGRPGTCFAFVEPKYEHGGPNEQPVLIRHLMQRHAVTIVHADPRELELRGDEVHAAGHCVDVVYRDYETRDLLDLERKLGEPLHAMRHLFRHNRVVSSLVGDFDHKSCWELLTDEAVSERFFSVEERKLFRRHVLWTRLLYPRRTTLPTGEGDLLEHARTHREQLVLKPNRAYGGVGVHVGSATEQGAWEALLDRALAEADDPEQQWVVQLKARLPVYELPVTTPDGRVHDEPFYAVMGFATTEHGVGVMCRVSQHHVVNVALRGGLAAVLVAHPPSELRAPKRAVVRAGDAEAALRSQIRELRHLDQAIGLLGWDEETYLPARGRPQRGEQIATLEALRHRLLVDDRVGDLVEEVAAQQALDADMQVELARLRRLRRTALALPEDLVRAFANARSQALAAWEAARTEGAFATFAPALARLLELIRERAGALRKSDELYDGLLDEYEPGMTRARLDSVLRDLASELSPCIERWSERSRSHAGLLAGKRFDEGTQLGLCAQVLELMGFDLTRGRMDRSTHPFTLLAGSDDVRLTIRAYDHDPCPALFATMHEGGHGLYDQGFSPEDRDRLLGEAPGMGIHESQSRLWENLVGRSRAFWVGFFPRLAAAFPEQLAGIDAERFYRFVNVVEPSVNRVEADEATYNLHILLRYELELRLLSGELAVDELPHAWNERSRALLGVTPASDLDGCLQDVHWSLGAFGYFPTYTLGNLYAAQLAHAYAAQHDLAAELSAGQLTPLRDWLVTHVHRVGHRLTAEEIIRRATGQGLQSASFMAHLRAKHDG